jgi:UrcA family protein
MIIKTLATLAIATVALATGPAFAGQPEDTIRSVSYADLDLSTAAGVKTLHRRVTAALEAVCGSYEGTSSSAMQSESDDIAQCRVASRAQADQRVAAIVASNSQVASAR